VEVIDVMKGNDINMGPVSLPGVMDRIYGDERLESDHDKTL
jgi:hypothetical protein